MRFEAIRETLEPGRVHRMRWTGDGAELSYREVVDLWKRDAEFADAFTDALAQDPFEAYFWETPPVDKARIDRPFECVLLVSRSLAGLAPDPEPFREHLEGSEVSEGIASFWSLGGDALLLAPILETPPSAYPHLASFLRTAPREQRRALWRQVGEHVEARLSDRPLWVSTSGLGVAWLHVRLDSYPKYYQHHPFREPGL